MPVSVRCSRVIKPRVRRASEFGSARNVQSFCLAFRPRDVLYSRGRRARMNCHLLRERKKPSCFAQKYSESSLYGRLYCVIIWTHSKRVHLAHCRGHILLAVCFSTFTDLTCFFIRLLNFCPYLFCLISCI